jgi:nucleoside-diphosphate-sugar epimerase
MASGRALVTGATGFLGRALALRLKELGLEVTGLGRDRARGQSLVDAGVRFLPVDLGDADAVAAACAGHDQVVHCAALTSPWGRYPDFVTANVTATRHVIAASQKARVRRLVHVSSPSIYVDHRDRLAVREDEPLPARAINHYAATKRLAEDEIDRAHAAGLPVVTVRPQGIFGPGDRAIFPRLIRVAGRGRFPVIGDGENLIDVTYVDNVVDALVQALDAPERALGKKYNITNGEPVSNYALLDRVFTAVGVTYRRVHLPFALAYSAAGMLEAVHRWALRGSEPLLTRYSVCVLAKSRTLDITAARNDLGYHPRVGLDDGVQRFVRWYKEEAHAHG